VHAATVNRRSQPDVAPTELNRLLDGEATKMSLLPELIKQTIGYIFSVPCTLLGFAVFNSICRNLQLARHSLADGWSISPWRMLPRKLSGFGAAVRFLIRIFSCPFAVPVLRSVAAILPSLFSPFTFHLSHPLPPLRPLRPLREAPYFIPLRLCGFA